MRRRRRMRRRWRWRSRKWRYEEVKDEEEVTNIIFDNTLGDKI